MTSRRIANIAAAFAVLVSLASLAVAAASDADTAWRYTFLFLPLWPGLMLLAVARGVLRRGLSAAACVTAAVQYVLVESAFGGSSWTFALMLLPIAVAALTAGILSARCRAQKSPRGTVPVRV